MNTFHAVNTWPLILQGCALVASHMASDYSLRSWSIPQRDKTVISVGYCCICECSAIRRLLRLQRVSKRLLGELPTLHYFWFLKFTWFEQRFTEGGSILLKVKAFY